jgi:hypothetical protein
MRSALRRPRNAQHASTPSHGTPARQAARRCAGQGGGPRRPRPPRAAEPPHVCLCPTCKPRLTFLGGGPPRALRRAAQCGTRGARGRPAPPVSTHTHAPPPRTPFLLPAAPRRPRALAWSRAAARRASPALARSWDATPAPALTPRARAPTTRARAASRGALHSKTLDPTASLLPPAAGSPSEGHCRVSRRPNLQSDQCH